MNIHERRRIGVLDIAVKLHCHPASVPRLVKEGRLPAPDKLLNRNFWFEDEIDAAIADGIPPRPKKAEGAS
jgi:hypothetical protein